MCAGLHVSMQNLSMQYVCMQHVCMCVCRGETGGGRGMMYVFTCSPPPSCIYYPSFYTIVLLLSHSIQRIHILTRFAYPLTYYPFCWVLLLTAYLLHVLFHKSTSLYTSGNISIILFSPDTHMRVW